MKNYNVITDKLYEGKNQTDLEAVRQKMGFKSFGWLTFLQAREKELSIIKGAKSVGVFKGYSKFEEISKEGKKGDVGSKITSVSRPLGFANVFNLDQTKKYIKKKK